jgi:hypothetical protein
MKDFLKTFTIKELRHTLEVLKENNQEKNGRLLEYVGYDIAEELYERRHRDRRRGP